MWFSFLFSWTGNFPFYSIGNFPKLVIFMAIIKTMLGNFVLKFFFVIKVDLSVFYHFWSVWGIIIKISSIRDVLMVSEILQKIPFSSYLVYHHWVWCDTINLNIYNDWNDFFFQLFHFNPSIWTTIYQNSNIRCNEYFTIFFKVLNNVRQKM